MRTVKAWALILLCTGFASQGCALLVAGGLGAGAGAGAIAYIQGELRTTYAATLDRTWEASLAALKDLKILVKNAQKDATGGTIEAIRGDGTNVKLTLKSEGPDVTSVRVRVGTFGDERASKMISNEISRRMGRKA